MSDVDLANVSGEIYYDPSVILPLGSAHMNLGDIIAANDSDKVLLTNLAEISYQRVDSIAFSYPELNIVENISPVQQTIVLLPLSPIYPIVFPANYDLPKVTLNYNFDLGINRASASERIDSMKVAKAILSVKVNTNVANLDPSKLKFTVTFQNNKLRKMDGTASVLTIRPSSFNLAEDACILNFVIDMSEGVTSLPLKIDLEAQTGNSPIALEKNSKIDLEFSFKKLDWQVLYGNFDMSTVAATAQEIPVGLTENILNGAFKFSNPQISISAVSNVGMKLGFNLEYFKSSSDISSVYAHFDGKQSLTQNFDKRPFVPGETVDVNFKPFDKNWGETDKLFEIMPTKFEFKATPFSDTTDPVPSFLTPDAQIKVFFKTKIPMQFNAGSFYQYTDTLNAIFEANSKIFNEDVLNKIDTATFIFSIVNNLPIKSTLSFRFLDAMGTALKLTDCTGKKYEIASGQVSLKGKVIPGTSSQKIAIKVSRDELLQLKNFNNLEFKVRVEGADVDSKILFSTSNTLDFKLGLFVKLRVIEHL